MFQASDREKVTRGGLIALLGRLSTAVDGVFMFVAHFLYGGAEFGLFALTFGIVELMSQFVLGGFADAVTYFVARHHAGEREKPLYEAIASCVVWPFAISLVMLGVVLGGAPFVYQWAWSAEYPAHLVSLLRIAALALPLMVLMRMSVDAVKAHMDMRWATTVEIARPLVTFGVAAALASTGWGATALVIAWLVGYAVCTVIALYGYTRYFTIGRTASAISTTPTGGGQRREILEFAVPQGFNTLFNFGLVRIDVLMLSLWHGPELIAVYTLVSQAVRGILQAKTALVGVFGPLVAKYNELGNRAGIEQSLNELLRFTAHAAVPLLLLNLTFYPELATFDPGAQWNHSRLFPWLLATGPLLAAFFGLTGNLLLMTGHSRLLLVNSSIAIALNIGLNLLLIPPLGVLGAAIATMVSTVALHIVQLWQSYRRESIRVQFGNYVKPVVSLLIVIPGIVWMNGATGNAFIYHYGVAFGLCFKLALMLSGVFLFGGITFGWPGTNPERDWLLGMLKKGPRGSVAASPTAFAPPVAVGHAAGR